MEFNDMNQIYWSDTDLVSLLQVCGLLKWNKILKVLLRVFRPDERTYEDLLFLEDTLKKVHFGQELDRDKRMQICKVWLGEFFSLPGISKFHVEKTIHERNKIQYWRPSEGNSMLSSGFKLAWVQFLEYECMKKKNVVFHQGDIGHEFFIILSGEVSISLKLPGEEEVCFLRQEDS